MRHALVRVPWTLALIIPAFGIMLSGSSDAPKKAAFSSRSSTRGELHRSTAVAPTSRASQVKRASCADGPSYSYSMFVPLAHARFFGTVDFTLNNRGIVGHEVTPTWYVEGRGSIVGHSIVLPPSQVSFHSIDELLPSDVSLSDVQGLELSYDGKLREVWAQAVLRPVRRTRPAQSVDAVFTLPRDFKSNVLEAVFGHPSALMDTPLPYWPTRAARRSRFG